MTCQLGREGGMPTGNETNFQIPFFAPVFGHAAMDHLCIKISLKLVNY